MGNRAKAESKLRLSRSVSASFQQSMDLRGIEVYRFTLHPNTLAAPVDNPDNHCFCKDHRVTKNCSLAGALDISSCQNSARPQSRRLLRHATHLFTSGLRCRYTHLYLSASLPLRQPHPAEERAGPESQRGASHDLPGRGASESSFRC